MEFVAAEQNLYNGICILLEIYLIAAILHHLRGAEF